MFHAPVPWRYTPTERPSVCAMVARQEIRRETAGEMGPFSATPGPHGGNPLATVETVSASEFCGKR